MNFDSLDIPTTINILRFIPLKYFPKIAKVQSSWNQIIIRHFVNYKIWDKLVSSKELNNTLINRNLWIINLKESKNKSMLYKIPWNILHQKCSIENVENILSGFPIKLYIPLQKEKIVFSKFMLLSCQDYDSWTFYYQDSEKTSIIFNGLEILWKILCSKIFKECKFIDQRDEIVKFYSDYRDCPKKALYCKINFKKSFVLVEDLFTIVKDLMNEMDQQDKDKLKSTNINIDILHHHSYIDWKK